MDKASFTKIFILDSFALSVARMRRSWFLNSCFYNALCPSVANAEHLVLYYTSSELSLSTGNFQHFSSSTT